MVKGTLDYDLTHNQRFMFVLGVITGVFMTLVVINFIHLIL